MSKQKAGANHRSAFSGITSNRDHVVIGECGEARMKRRNPHLNEIILCRVFTSLGPQSNMLMARYGTFEPKSEPIVENFFVRLGNDDSNMPRFKPADVGSDTYNKEIRVIEFEQPTGSLGQHQTWQEHRQGAECAQRGRDVQLLTLAEKNNNTQHVALAS